MTTSVGGLLRSAARGKARVWAGLVVWSTVEALPAFLSGLVIARAIDDGFLARDLRTGFLWLGVLAAAVVIGAVGTRQTYLRLARLVEPLRDELVRRTAAGSLRRTAQPGAQTGTQTDPAVAARLSQHTEIVREAYASVLMATQGFVVAVGGAAFGLLSLSPVLVLVVLPPVAAALALFGAALRRLASKQRQAILAEEQIAATLSVSASGIRDVVASGGEGLVRGSVDRHIEDHAVATRDLARLTALRTAAVALGGWLPLVLVLALGPWLLDNGATAGVLVGALAYVSQVLHPALEALVRSIGGPGLWLLVTLRRIAEATDADEQPERTSHDQPAGPAAPSRNSQSGTGQAPKQPTVRLRDVTFSYGVAAAPVVQGLDLDLEDGEHLAVVGPSGVGKSTLARLISGLLSPQSGSVTVGGTAVAALDANSAAALRVLVPQDGYVFSGTMRENICYHRDLVSSAELIEAIEALGLQPLLRQVGMDNELRPQELSAGHRQLVALARAYLSPAPLVVLDEATCYLDATTEARVEAAFASRPGSLVVIAHRLSSAQRARRVLVLDAGTALAGTHEELLDRSERYRDLMGHWAPASESRGQRVPAS